MMYRDMVTTSLIRDIIPHHVVTHLGPQPLHVDGPGVPGAAPPLLLLRHGRHIVRVSLPFIIISLDKYLDVRNI